MSSPAAAFGEVTKFKELRQRIIFLIGALIVYRIGTFIPVPGVDPVALQRLFDQLGSGSLINLFNMFSGGALERLSIFALGIMPYISSAIIIQMMSHVYPPLQQLRKEGEQGRRKITQYTRYGTVLLASFQSISAAIALQNQNVVIAAGPQFVFTAAVTLVTGTMFLMWLGEQVTERGIGNGISMLILAGIVSGLPAAIGGTFSQVQTGQMLPAVALMLLIVILGVLVFVVFIERGQRRIAVNYARRQQGRKMYAGQTTHLPFKINMAGVIPPIFASSLIIFPGTIANWFGTSENLAWLQQVSAALTPGQPIYMMLYAALIIFFCFFYTALVVNSRETAENLKKSGAFIPGIRPGQQTAEYLDTVLTRLTFWGAIYVSSVCLVPEFMRLFWSVPFYFGGTSLLIIVVVVMDFMSQLQAHMMSHQYEGLLKKANLRGYGRSGQIR
ncbi:MAG: preprotein translocase subunit SecY [Gammaproteobacteria bacterium]